MLHGYEFDTLLLYQRRRTPCAQELDGIPWLRLLNPMSVIGR